jgi:hypothetical protein
MQIKKVTHTIITASEGHILTNGTNYGPAVALSKYDDPDNWYEITEEKYQEIVESQEEIAE